MPLPKTLKNFTAFIDGVGYVGRIEEGTLPKTALQVAEYQGGGMAAPVDISMGSVEKMETTLTFAEYSPALMGKFGHDDVPIVLRGALGEAAEPMVVTTRGLFREADPGSWKAGEKGTLQVVATLSYLKITINGEEVVEIDAVNGVFVSGGKDHTAAIRAALGL